MTLFRRWLVPYLVTGAVLLVIVWAFAYRSVSVEREQTVAQSAGQAQRLAKFFEQNVLEIFRYSDTYLAMARRVYLKNGSVDAVATFMADIPLNQAIVSHITVMDKTGKPLFISGHKIKPGTTAKDRTYFKFQAETPGDQPYISLPRKGRNTGKLTVRLVRRINNPDGSFHGVIFAAIDVANITKLSAAMSLGSKSSATLVGTDKRIRARSSYGRVGPGQDISGSRIWRELAQRPVGLYQQRSVVDNVTRFYAYRLLSEFPLIVAIGVATEDISTAVSAYEIPTYAIAILISLVIIVITGAVCREIYRTRLDLERRESTELELRESEARFREILEKSPMGVSVITMEHPDDPYPMKRLFANEAFAQLIGMPLSEGLLDANIADTWVDQVEMAKVGKLMARGVSLDDYEAARRRKDGSKWWDSMNSRPIVFGGRESVMTWHFDITERKAAVAALQQSERQLRTITNALPASIIYLDSNERYRYANKTAEDWYGQSAEDLMGKSIEDVHGAVLNAKVQSNIAAVFAGETVTFEAAYRYPDGNTRDVRIMYIPEFDDRKEVQGFYGFTLDLTASKQTELALRETEAHLAHAIESISEGFILYDPDDRFVMCNEKFKDFFPAIQDELIVGKSLEDLARLTVERGAVKDRAKNVDKYIRERLWDQNTGRGLREQELADGRWLLSRERKTADGFTVGIRTDITEIKLAADQLRRSQRLEAVGQLTGGVAHDFNNILAAIIGNLDLIEDRGIIDNIDGQGITVALRAARRGAELIDRLLAFSRKQDLVAQITDIHDILPQFRRLAERTIGEDIAIELHMDPDLWPTIVDPGQLENALLNLAINARDAMPDGGTLTIKTGNLVLDAEKAGQYEELAPGDYTIVTVTDTGGGMGEDVRARAFEPFFTTKDVGKGSGLGLSMVFGFAKQSGGHVTIDSTEDAGTIVRIFLPRAAEQIQTQAVADNKAKEERPRGDETILVVEDDKDVRMFLARALSRQGYAILEAEDGPAAVRIMEQSETIDLLLTDVILPRGMNGRDVADAFRDHYPAAGIIYSSGYTREILDQRGRIDKDVVLMSKPFHPHTVALRVRGVLDNR